MKLRIVFVSVCMLLFLLAAASCGGVGGKNTDDITATPAASLPPPAVDRKDHPLKVVVSLPIFADMARIIGGDQVTVTSLIPPGVSPHDYVPSADLAQAVTDADVIFYNGLGLDSGTQRFVESHLAPRPPMVLEIVKDVPSPSAKQGVDKPVYAKDVGDDPHLFLDPALAPSYAENISHSLIIADAQNKPYYDARFLAYKAQIETLNSDIAREMSAIPAANKSLLVTYHNSLIWFAKRYGLSVAGTLQDNGEDGLAQVIAEKHPPAVFTETGFDSSGLTALAAQAGIKVCNIDTDTIPNGDTTYLQMMRHTADTIAQCLS